MYISVYKHVQVDIYQKLHTSTKARFKRTTNNLRETSTFPSMSVPSACPTTNKTKNKTAPSLTRCKRQTGKPRLQTRAVQAPMQISGRERTGRCVRVSGQPHASPPWSFLGIPTLSQTRCSLARRERRAVYDRAKRQTSAHYAPRERP